MWASLNKASSLHRHPTERLLSGLASSKEPLHARHIDVATSGVTAQTDCKTKRQTPSPVFQYTDICRWSRTSTPAPRLAYSVYPGKKRAADRRGGKALGRKRAIGTVLH